MTDKPVWEAGVINAHVTSNENPSFTAGYNARQPEVDELRAEVERLRPLNERQQVLIQQARDERDESDSELERLRATLDKGRRLVEDMDLRMPEQATEDADGWINSYRIPVGPWHRLLGWARGGAAW